MSRDRYFTSTSEVGLPSSLFILPVKVSLIPGAVPHSRRCTFGKTRSESHSRSPVQVSGLIIILRDAPMEVDSCWSVASYETLEAVPLELAENFAVGVECRQSVFSSIEDDGWTELKMRDRVVYLQKPGFVRDDATDKSLDPAKANAGMAKEIRALDSLRVGDAITKQEADAYCREHGIRILSTRWVSVAKKDGETKEDIVRARVVARDYASGSPTAAELGISSPTSSNEAFRSFLVFVSATESEIVLADVSTAFLFALIVSPESPFGGGTSGA